VSADERQLAEDLRERLEAAVQEAEQAKEVAEAVGRQRAAEARVTALKRGERLLNQHAKETGDKLAAMRQSSVDALIEAAAGGGKLEFKSTAEIAGLEHRARHISRAIEKLVEELIPEAEAAAFRGESYALVAKSRAMEQMAHERAEKVLQQLRGAVSDEVVLPVDLSKGVSGALMAQAAELKRRAIELSERASQIEKTIRR
jgi:ribosomal protein S9